VLRGKDRVGHDAVLFALPAATDDLELGPGSRISAKLLPVSRPFRCRTSGANSYRGLCLILPRNSAICRATEACFVGAVGGERML
jgi:hypothetical protein